MSRDQIVAKIEELQHQISQRANQLMAADPVCQNLMGQITAYKAMLTPEKEEAQ